MNKIGTFKNEILNSKSSQIKNNTYFLYSCGRDGSFKKFLVSHNSINLINYNNKSNNNLEFNLCLKESKNFYSLNSIEDFFIIEHDKYNNKNYKKNDDEIENLKDNIYFVGHYGRNICFYDSTNNLNFYSYETKGVHRPYDFIIKNDEGKKINE
jgi:hypothetical protein